MGVSATLGAEGVQPFHYLCAQMLILIVAVISLFWYRKEAKPNKQLSQTADVRVKWRLPTPDSRFEYGDSFGNLKSHWCKPPAEEEWRLWAASNDGIAVRQPELHCGQWRVWCFCGHEMSLSTVSKDQSEDLHCCCGKVGESICRPVGSTLWRCNMCASTHKVSNRFTGEPQGVPASPVCRALRYQGHALINCLGTRYAYGSVLPEHFHFGSSGVTASIDAVWRLRRALVEKDGRVLLRLQDMDANVLTLREALAGMQPTQAELLLFAYASAGRARLIEVLLDEGVCNINMQREKDGCTALHVARYRHHNAVADMLLARGADCTVLNKWGETPDDAAKCVSR